MTIISIVYVYLIVIRFTALHYAVYVNSVKCVEFLVRNSYATHVPSADERGVTPLILASEFGYNEVLNALLVNTNIASEINQCDVNGLSGMISINRYIKLLSFISTPLCYTRRVY